MKTGRLNRTVNFKFGQSLRIGTLVEIRQVNENTCMVRQQSEPTVEYLVSKDALDKPTMYFKDEGGYYSYKLTKEGQPIDPMELYEYGSLQELTCTSQRMAKIIAKGHNLTAVFG